MLAPWKKAMTNLDSILKSKDITLLTKVHIAKAMVFPIVMYRCENWTIKKTGCQRIDAFKLWCWKRLLLLGRKAMTNLNSIVKRRDITLLTKVLLVKDMVFPIVMHGLDHKES